LKSRIWLYGVAWSLLLVIFAVENRHVLTGPAAHLFYVGVVLIGLWAPGTTLGPQIAAAATVLTIAGHLLNPPDGDPTASYLTLGVSIVVQWVTAFGVTLYGRSIAAQRQAEAALGQSTKDLEGLRYALDQSAIVARTNVRGDITYVNNKFCEISKYSRDELIGANHRILNSGLHSTEFFKEMYGQIGRGHVWRGEIRNRAKDGTLYWVDTTIVPLLDARSHPHQYIAIRYDITERKAAEAALREQEALAQIGKMAAVVAHEVRNPLAGMRGALQIIDRRLAPESRERGVIREIVARIDGLTDIVQDLLVFARPRPPAVTAVPLQAFMREIATLLAADPQFTNVELSIDVDSTVMADREQLQLVLQNLLVNAAQAMHGRGVIRISAQDWGDGWREIRIADSGSGIPLEIRARLFEPFFTTKHRGTGLGLATARRLIQAHGGSVEFEFPPDGGTTAVIRLPARTASEPSDGGVRF
jgi:PAS domain S-box-containing protein